MYLPSKLRAKYIGTGALVILLALLPFKSFIQYFFLSFSRNLLISPQNYRLAISELKKKNLALLLKNRKLDYLRAENKKLTKALRFNEKKGFNPIGVEIISFDPSSWRRIIIIDAGKDKGLRKGLLAIDEDGVLIGKISEVKGNYARLILATDPDFSLPVFVGKDAFGMLKGGLDGAKVFYVEKDRKVNLKEKVWLKVSPGALPIYVGEIAEVSRTRNSLFSGLEVRLFSQNPFLHKIFIVR